MVTLKDIANHVGISITAASLALRDHKSISIETKQQVWDAQERLGYHRHQRLRRAGRNRTKVSSRTHNIAFLLVDRLFKDLAYADYFQAISDAASGQGYRPTYLSARAEDLRQGIFPPILKNGEIDGIIVSGVYDETEHRQLKRLGIPIVVLGNYDLGPEPWAACETDDRGGIRLMVDRLSELGHRRMGLILCSTSAVSNFQMQRAYLQCLERNQAVNAGIETVRIDEDIQGSLVNLMKKRERPTALIVPLMGIAVHVYDACETLRLKIPDDISVICYGHGANLQRPSIATVLTDYRAYASGAVAKLSELIANPQRLVTREVFPMHLMPGGSIGKCAEGETSAILGRKKKYAQNVAVSPPSTTRSDPVM